MKLKVVLIGPPNSGKTLIFNRLKSDEFSENVLPSTQPSLFRKDYEDRRVGAFSVEYWDTAGQERYRAITPLFFQDAHLSVVVFDLSDADSFAQAKEWVAEVKQRTGSAGILLVGNKTDLVALTPEELSDKCEYAQSIGAEYFRTSAKTGDGLQVMFDAAVRCALAASPVGALQCEECAGGAPPAAARCC